MNRLRLRKWLKWLGVAATLVIALYWGVPWLAPLPEGLRQELPESRIAFDRNGKVLCRLLYDKRFRHERVALGAVPPALIDATLAAEDKRFFQHAGIDFLALCRSLRDNVRRFRTVSGASTISQQLVKISSPPTRRSLWTKLREMMIARQLEMRFSKEQILEMYLNRLDYGGMNRGCSSAAQCYFQKPVSELSVAESALLAGLPQAPSRLNPLRHPDAAKQRQCTIISRLTKMQPDRASELERTALEPLRFRPLRERSIAQHAVSLALRTCGDETRVRITVDYDLQNEVEVTLRNEVAALASRNVHNAAAVVIDNATGEILALAGSSDFNSPLGGQINGALRPRSAGSTLKAFTYLLAFEKGASPGDIIADVSTRYPDSGGFFTPENYDRVFHGPMSLREALANSENAAAVRLLQKIGGAGKLLDTLHQLRFTNLEKGVDHYGLGLTIGNAEVRLLDVVNGYACIARMGEYRPWKIVAQPDGNPERVFSADICYLLADVLSDNAARSPAFGSESPLRFTFRVGCKTGTSSDFRDNWCIAFTPCFTVGVWMGNQNGSPMQGVSGVTGAATAVHLIMTKLALRGEMTWYARPPGVVAAAVDRRTGHIVFQGQVDPQWVREEIFRRDAMPACAQPQDYDEAGRAILADEEFAEWFRSPFNRFPAGFALRSIIHPASIEPRVLNPVSGSTYLLDPELPGSGRNLTLVSNLEADAEWSSPTLEIGQLENRPCAVLVPGTHKIVLKNRRSGAVATAQIQVEKR